MSELILPAPVKLIALDLDGTLLNEEMQIVEGNADAVHEARRAGIHVIVATGRSMKVARRYMDELGLTGPQITVNGGEVWATPDQLIRSTFMQMNDMIRLHMLAETYNVWYWMYGSEGVYNKSKPPKSLEGQDWLKFGYYSTDPKILSTIRRQLETWGNITLSNSSPDNIEINPPGIDKGNALAEVCAMLNIPIESAAAMGDSLNDMSMIRAAGTGIAMGNAQDELKAAARWVSKTNVEGGVAVAIRRILEAQS